MPKTEVILTSNIVGLGAESDQVKVAAGYARNFLFPQGLAIPQTSANKRRLDALRKRRLQRETHELNTMTELSKGLSKLTVVIKVKAGEDGKMFGSVTPGTIADELKHQFDVALDKKKIHLKESIRAIGEHEVELHLHADVQTTLKVRVEHSAPHAKIEEAPMPEKKEATPGKGDARKPELRKPEARKVEPKKERADQKTRPEKNEGRLAAPRQS